MKTPDKPANEQSRLHDLRGYQWADAETDHLFEHITALAAKICEVPQAVISIVDEDRQWFKAAQGVTARETPRDISFCAHAILGEGLFEVSNASEDRRFADNPLVVTPGGVRFYAGMPIVNKRGHALGTVCVLDSKPRQLTQSQKEALGQLRDMALELLESRRRKVEALQYWNVLSQMDSEIYFWDPETTQIIYANEGASRNLQYSLAELQTMTLLDLGPTYTEESLRDIVAHLDETSRQATVSETVRRRRDGSTYPVEIRVQMIEFEGRKVCVSIANDITRRKRIEQMKADFISTVSHELRTPLTSIMGSLGLLKAGAAGQLPGNISKLIEIAHSNSERLVRLINDILDIQKMEAGRLRFEEENFTLVPFVDQVVEANKGFADVHDVGLVLLDGGEDVTVYADKDRLAQIITNLLSNAIKFSPPGGAVEVRVTRHEDRFCRISVVDQGPGVPANFHGAIFEPFAQADSSDARQKGGSGLGLHIAKTIIERMGGRIGFASAPGRGATFYVDLPLTCSVVHHSACPEGNNRAAVLVCEDNADIARLLVTMLEKDGFYPVVAPDAATARRLLGERRFTAMTLDLRLPDADGVTLISELRADPSTAGLPIVVVSASAEDGREALKGGAVEIVDWLSKPVDQGQLIAALNRAVATDEGVTKILHVEDDPSICELVAEILGSTASLTSAHNLDEARQALTGQPFDLILLDVALAGESGLDLLPHIGTLPQSTPVLVFSAQELGRDLSSQITAALVKSRTSNESLKRTILQLAHRQH